MHDQSLSATYLKMTETGFCSKLVDKLLHSVLLS